VPGVREIVAKARRRIDHDTVQAVGSLPLVYGIQAGCHDQNLRAPDFGYYTVSNAQIAPSLGRNLSSCPATTGACNSTVNIDVLQPQTKFEDRVKPGGRQTEQDVPLRQVSHPGNAGRLQPVQRQQHRWFAPLKHLRSRVGLRRRSSGSTVKLGAQLDFIVTGALRRTPWRAACVLHCAQTP